MKHSLITSILVLSSILVMNSCLIEEIPSLNNENLRVGYHFEDFSNGNALDYSLNYNDGTPTDLKLVDGKYGKGILFNQNTSTLELRSIDEFTKGITVDFWLYLNEQSDNNFKNIIEECASFDNLTFQIGLRNDTVIFNFYKNEKKTEGVRSILAKHTWNHLSFNYNGSSIMLYVNGELVDSNEMLMGAVNSWNTIHIGKSKYPNYHYEYLNTNSYYLDYLYPFNGIIDEFRIWNYCYNENEVKNLLMIQQK